MAIGNPLVMLDSLKKTDSGYRLTLYNASEQPQTATVRLFALGKELEVHLGKCELKFVDISV